MKASFKNYGKPTPARWKRIGDAILILGTTLSASFTGMEVDKGWIMAAILLTALGKMVPNLFSDDETSA